MALPLMEDMMLRPEIADYFNRIRQPFNVNQMAQAAALAALDDEQHLQKTLKTVQAGKDYLYKELAAADITYIPSSTNFGVSVN